MKIVALNNILYKYKLLWFLYPLIFFILLTSSDCGRTVPEGSRTIKLKI